MSVVRVAVGGYGCVSVSRAAQFHGISHEPHHSQAVHSHMMQPQGTTAAGVQAHTLLVVPSSLDLIRIRKVLMDEDVDCCICSE